MSILTLRYVNKVFGGADNGVALITAASDVSQDVQSGVLSNHWTFGLHPINEATWRAGLTQNQNGSESSPGCF
jgi:hypothetical protein